MTRIAVDAALLATLCLVGIGNYLLFHSLAEVLTAVVAGGIFVVFWNTRRFLNDGFYTVLGIGYLAAGAIDLLHALAFKGINVFPDADANLPTQLWIAARYLQAATVLAAVLLLGRRLRPRAVLAAYAVLLATILAAIFPWDVFPDCYIEGRGLTPFKRVSEYVIAVTVLGAFALLVARRARLDRTVFNLFASSLVVTAVSEIAFTFYVRVDGPLNYGGHVLKILAFYLVYRGFIEAGLSRPLGVLFRNLKRQEDDLKQWAQTLEDRVAQRTAELLESREALRQSELRFRRLFEAAPDGVVITDAHGRIEFVNRQMETIFGRKADELLGQSIDILAPEDLRARHAEHREAYRNAPRTRPMGSGLDLSGRRSDGSLVPVEIMLSPLDTPDGLCVMAIVRDVTERKRLEDALRQSERLAAIGQMMTGLSHESRNALQRSLACLEMLEKRIRDIPAAMKLLEGAQKAQQDLIRAYEAVRGYAAPVVLECERIDVSSVWRAAWEKLAPLREGRAASLREQLNGTHLHCELDTFRMEQVFRNLLENSLAACPDPVEITIDCADVSLGTRPAIRIALRDNGPGVDPALRDRIFEPFFTTKTHGTGLGMSLVRRIVEEHGGHIEIDPRPGQGLETSLTLPRSCPTAATRLPQPPHTQA